MSSFKPSTTQTKQLKCQNSDPETSKYWKYAPHGGCDEVVEVDVKTDRVLCHKCTMRSVQG